MQNVIKQVDSAVSIDPQLVKIIEDATRELQRGNRLNFDAVMREHPSHAAALRDLLPTIATLVGLTDKNPTPRLHPPERLGSYQLLGKLGSGGMGNVFLALHCQLQKTVALKVLPGDRTMDAQSVARFQREMTAIGRFEHPNIVRATDAGEQDGIHYLIMEYIDGLDVGNLLRRVGPLSIADACEICRQAAVGLAFICEQGLVHRDVKPSNLMLTKDGQIKVLDLGLARFIGPTPPEHGPLTGTGQMLGTFDYMAPEQADDSRDVDERVDVYSLGATLYHLLTGRAPFADANHANPIRKMIAMSSAVARPINELRPDVPAALATVISHMIAKDPKARMASCTDAATSLARFAAASNLQLLMRRAAEHTAESDVPTSAPITTSKLAGAGTFGDDTPEPPRAISAESATDNNRIAATVATGQTQRAVNSPPFWRKRSIITTAAVVVPLLIAAYVVIVRDRDGQEKARLTVAPSDVIEIKPNDEAAEVQPDSRGTIAQSESPKNTSKDTSTPPDPSAAKPAQAERFSLSFDGKAGFVEVPGLVYSGDTPITIELRAAPASQQGYQQLVLVSNFDYKEGQSYGLGLFQRGDVYPTPNYASWAMAVSGQEKESQSLNGPPDAWKVGRASHIAFIADGQKFRFYLDGKLWRHGALEHPAAISKIPFTIGGHKFLKGYFNGTLDEIRISSVARYADNFTPSDRFDPDNNTLALFHCDEGTGKVLVDSSRHHRDGKIRGVKWIREDESPAKTELR